MRRKRRAYRQNQIIENGENGGRGAWTERISSPFSIGSCGAACLAGLAVGMWKDREELRQRRLLSQNYEPHMDQARREQLLRGWHKAVGRSLDWEEHT